ncbi:MAG: peptidylprolyl isomerase, partial [Bacteroidales bacterium]|nr:peptidylprolyl isomerase [Bacteroidales bacterium]
FGEVVEGLEVVEKIQNCATGSADRPKQDITMKMSLLKD